MSTYKYQKNHSVQKKALFSEKVIAFLYSSMINFCRTKKVKSISLSKKFIKNLKIIMKNSHCKLHSHVTGEIKGYAHMFCNKKVRENYFRIPVIAHNLFRFDFFLLKGMRSGVWKTRDIFIRGKISTVSLPLTKIMKLIALAKSAF